MTDIKDRVSIHEELAARYDSSNDYLWGITRGHQIEVRVKSDEITLPKDDLVTFSVDLIPRYRCKNKRKMVPLEYYGDFAESWFKIRMANVLKVVSINTIVGYDFIPARQRHNRKSFTTPYATISGMAEIVDRDELKKLMLNGIGEMKAYGFGLINIKEIQYA